MSGTPGPWRHVKDGYITARDTTSRSEAAIIHVAKVGAFQDQELLPFKKKRWQADADLIAQAPDLWAEVERLTVERDKANDAALRWARVLREIVDLAHKRAYRQIERLARDTLGGVERPEEHQN